MDTSIEIQKFVSNDSIIIEKLFSVYKLVTSFSTTHSSPFVSQKEKKWREFKSEIEKVKWPWEKKGVT